VTDEQHPKSYVRDLIYGAVGAVCVASIGWTANVAVDIRDTVRSLQQYHASEWPLERQLLSIETTQLRSQVSVLRAEIDELTEELEALR